MRRFPSGGVCTTNLQCGLDTPYCCDKDDGSGRMCMSDECVASGDCTLGSDCPQPESQVCCAGRCYDGDCCENSDCEFQPCKCCDNIQVLGECCVDGDCPGDQQCIDNNCKAEASEVVAVVSFNPESMHSHIPFHSHPAADCTTTAANVEIVCSCADYEEENGHNHIMTRVGGFTISDTNHQHETTYCPDHNHGACTGGGACGLEAISGPTNKEPHNHSIVVTGDGGVINNGSYPMGIGNNAHGHGAHASFNHQHPSGCGPKTTQTFGFWFDGHTHPDLCFNASSVVVDCETGQPIN